MTIPDSLAQLLKEARVKHFPKGQIIQYEGDEVRDVFVVKKGIVKVYDIDDQGNEKVLHIIKSPALFPFAFFSGSSATTNWFYGALTDCDAHVLQQSTLRKRVEADSHLAITLIENFSEDVHELLVRLSSLGKTTKHDKLLVALRFLAVRHATQRPSGWWRVQFPANHQLLADLVGVTRESVAVVMKELQDKKIIRNPRVTILEIDKEKLFKEMGEEA